MRTRNTLTVGILGATLLAAIPASAQSTIRQPGDHRDYSVEIEPKLDFGFLGSYGGEDFGVGARFSIPVVKNGFIPSINNNVAIGFGLDFQHYTGCYYAGYCNANSLEIPVVMQWNFFLTKEWSVFAEPGLYIYHGFLDCPSGVNCSAETGIYPAFYVGGRYKFNDTVGITFRLGYPEASIGISIFP